MPKVWKINKNNIGVENSLSQKLNIHPITANLLKNRGITEPQTAFKFLNCSLDGLHNPFLMKDMDKAVNRILKAISNKERILIHGDYDVDGITGVALLYKYLKILGAKLEWHIPNRLEEGYGLGEVGVRYAKEKEVSVVIPIDCGIVAFEPIKWLEFSDIDVIIVDHHQPNHELPPADAILDPWRDDCNYPYPELSGVGIGFKLCQALCRRSNGNFHELVKFLDLVALGTIADISHMRGENRILSKFGLKYFNELNHPGLKALVEVAGFTKKNINPEHISFIFAPRLNASGRLGAADESLQLLLCEDMIEARRIAKRLDKNNTLRQKIQKKTLKEAVQRVQETFDFSIHKVIVLYAPHWHPGVVGIVASNLIEKYNRPTLILCGEEICQGSGRSIEGFNLYQAVNRCGSLLESFGGHEAACGVTIKQGYIPKFREAINNVAESEIHFKKLIPHIGVEAKISLSLLSKNLISEIENMSPFGPNNPKPIFCSLNLNLKNSPQYLSKKGLKLWVSDGNFTYKAIGFGESLVSHNLNPKHPVHIAYSPYIDRWKGRENIGLKIKDIKVE